MQPAAASRLSAAGAVVLASIPPAMAVANKASPAFVGLAALLFLASAAVEKGRGALSEIAAPLRAPLGLAALAFLGWCLVSIAWSPFPGLSLKTFSEFGPTLLGAYLLARLAPERLPAWALPLAAALLIAACVFMLVNLVMKFAPLRALGQRNVALFVLNRPAMTILLIAIPVVAWLAARRSWIAAAATGLVCAGTILRTISGAAALGLAVAVATVALVWLLPKRIGLASVAVILALAFVLAPVEGDILQRFMPEAAHARLVQSSSRARVAIAQSFGAAVAADPWRGAGYATGAAFDQTAVARTLEPEMQRMLAVGHPHNSFLQIWVELGVIGATLAAAVLFLTLRAIAALPKLLCVAALSLVAGASAIAFVEHGAWQAWWTAGLGAAICWLRGSALDRPGTRSDEEPRSGAA